MKNTIRIVALIGALMIVGALGVAAFASGNDDLSPTPVASFSASEDPTPDPTSSPSVGDGDEFKGNCDEAEHAGDPECQGVALVPEDDPDDDNAAVGEDISGN